MKKILIILLIGIFCFTACGKTSTFDEGEETLKEENLKEDSLKEDTLKEDTLKVDTLKEELVMEIPEGFTTTETEEGYIYYTNDEDMSSIMVAQIIADGSLESFDAQILVDGLAENMRADGIEDANVTLLEEKWYEIDGHEAYKVVYSYELYGKKRVVDTITIQNGDIFECITFTNKVEEGYKKIFKKAEESIHFE